MIAGFLRNRSSGHVSIACSFEYFMTRCICRASLEIIVAGEANQQPPAGTPLRGDEADEQM